MRLALYGGTFDPVHHGHLIMARDALEKLELDRVIFIPAGLSPHKLATVPAPATLRREMVSIRKEREEVRSRVEKMLAQIDRMVEEPAAS